MQTVPREPVRRQANDSVHKHTAVQPVRKRARININSTELNFSDRLVDLVTNEYPGSNEEASVLLSKVWNMIEQEIMLGLTSLSSKKDYHERIGVVSAFYDIAVQQLNDMNKPFLRQGAVADYYNPL
jgi:hypothetical protein